MEAGNVIETTHEHAGEFKEWCVYAHETKAATRWKRDG
jgi:hypothetical protein